MIFQLVFIAPFGTCEKQTVQRRILPLARALAARGHQVDVLIPAWDCPSEAGQIQFEERLTIRFPTLGPAPHRLADPLLLKRILKETSALQPDLVHIFKPIGYGSAAGEFLAGRRVPIIVDHDDLETSSGWGARHGWIRRKIAEGQEKRINVKAQGISVASEKLLHYVAQYRRAPNEVLLLANGVIRAPGPAVVSRNLPVALLYTRGNDVSAEDIKALWPAILAEVPDARLLVVGDWAGMPDLPRCEHLGWLEADALCDVIRQSAVSLFPVSDTDLVRAKSPARVLDCLAQGLPVITLDVGEYANLVGRQSDLVAKDSVTFVSKAVQLLSSAQDRARAGLYCWQRAEIHNWMHRAKVLETWYEALYSEMLK